MMTEETIFAEAIEKSTPAERTAFLDAACGGDAGLRQRVEALLQSHAREDFLKTPAIQRAAEVAGGSPILGATAAEVHGDDSESAMDFLVPSAKPDSLGRLGHYEVQEIIGRGGMGVVLRAFDEKLHRVVAIKVMAAQLATNATARKRFTREAQAQAAVSHDHIVTIHAVEADSQLPHLVMQFISGMSLQERLDKSGPIQLHEILRIGMQTASALAAAHAQGLVHRDIKPANILLENGVERVKITDFGLARAATEASLTQSGVVAGTPQYMSPEQAEGKAIDQRTDLFSLGSVMYAMCTGRAPFRASGSMAVLKRVCEETPTPIRQTNPDIPDWLVAIIDKLHAKDPAQRYQSAAEVAELLGRHLAHLQHPSVVPLLPPASGRPTRGEWLSPAQPRRRRLVVAAAVLLCFLVGLSLTEATGVTNVRGTVIRIFTPDGTLVVDINDPGVKVTIEGDGGLTITGAGLEEIRLRPGSYKVHADRDGKPFVLDRELVSIAKGGREIVKVKMEEAPASAPAQSEKGAFVLLGGNQDLKFDTLAEAVTRASDGDTIEIRGHGPFLSQPIEISQALTLRAGSGYRPVIRLREEVAARAAPLLHSTRRLTVEGLDFQRLDLGGWREPVPVPCILSAVGTSLHVANCSFRSNYRDHDHIRDHATACQIRNCLFISPSSGGSVDAEACQTLVVENCLHAGNIVLGLRSSGVGKPGVEVALSRNTLVTGGCQAIFFGYSSTDPPWKPATAVHPIKVDATGNLFDTGPVLQFGTTLPKAAKAEELESMLRRLLTWAGRENLWRVHDHFVMWGQAPNTQPDSPHGPRSLNSWKTFWGTPEPGSIEGTVRYQGGHLGAKLATAPEKLTPDDFRLRPDSAGYKAGKDGKDLGADVDLVGPGPAYERWKKTPEYQQWLKDTKQVSKAEAPKAEPKAFALLGGKGVAERKFDTLAEAVLGSTDGDTIEVRGNGPFVVDRLEFNSRLTIRAGAGFRPVLTARPKAELPGGSLLVARGPLRLEGLEIRGDSRSHQILHAQGPLWLANCRFHAWICIEGDDSCVARNCELVSASGAPIVVRCSSDATSDVANSVLVGHINLDDRDLTRGAAVRFSHNTIVTLGTPPFCYALLPMDPPPEQIRKHSGKRVEAVVRENILAGGSQGYFSFGQYRDFKPRLDPADAEAWIPRRVKWTDERNIYRPVETYIRGIVESAPGQDHFVFPVSHGKGLSGWNQFWALKDTGSSEGVLRFQGGDLSAKAAVDATKLIPEDFRLRPDSAGYKAGKGGKDIGADVDLVGPGPAYERWKKTPEYQQWLNDTKQVSKAEAPKAEPKAFVVLGGKGVTERKFDTLAEAVLGSTDGDTIEVRGNGPFVTKPITLGNAARTIRAGPGFRPVLRIHAEKTNDDLITASGPLVLEGLEIRDITQQHRPTALYSMLFSSGSSLHLANCRLLQEQPHQPLLMLITAHSLIRLRNCEFYTPNPAIVNAGTSVPLLIKMENCLGLGNGGASYVHHCHATNTFVVEYRRNTLVVARLVTTGFSVAPEPPAPAAANNVKRHRIEAASNVFDIRASALSVEAIPSYRWQKLADAERVFTPVVGWREQGNVYSPGTRSIAWFSTDRLLPLEHDDRKDWERYWGLSNTGSLEGQIRLQGGDLWSRMTTLGAMKITPGDFRLRPDSAGYRAGKAGRDVGADVDLVGPGPAYERWKETPAYHEWLKDTNQVTKVEDAGKRELASWQGEWVHPDRGRLIIKGDRWSWHPKEGPEVVSTIKIVEVSDKMTHVLLLSTGPDTKVRTIQAIVRVDGDTLHNCGTAGPFRPTEFAQKAGYLYIQWNRVSQSPP